MVAIRFLLLSFAFATLAFCTALGGCDLAGQADAKARELYDALAANHGTALREIEDLARRGSAQAAFFSGLSYDPEASNAPDIAKAAAYYALAAPYLASAKFNLALLVLKGATVDDLDEEKAVELLADAARSGRAEALMILATIYSQGLGAVAPDGARAAEFYAKALAATGDPRAALGLGICFQDGRGCPVDLGRAQEFLLRAAEAGWPEAQARLAALAPSALQAAQWHLVAALNDASHEQAALAALAQLSEHDRVAATRAAKLWEHVHPRLVTLRKLSAPMTDP